MSSDVVIAAARRVAKFSIFHNRAKLKLDDTEKFPVREFQANVFFLYELVYVGIFQMLLCFIIVEINNLLDVPN